MAASSSGASFSVSSRDDIPKLRRFLGEIFNLSPDAPSFREEVLSWKYFDAHPWWSGGRSYQLNTADGMAAHGGIAPVRFDNQGHAVESMQVIDWAAGKAIPGAGLLIYRHCREVGGGTLLTLGGSGDAQAVFPQVRWLIRKNDVHAFARPLRPLRHFAEGAKNARGIGRLGRNIAWSLSPALPDSSGWKCRVARPGEPVFSHSGAFVPIFRTREWFDYLLRCPSAATELVILEKDSVPRGHAFLANVRGSVRVGDFVVSDPATHPERVSAFAALVRYIAAQPASAEVLAGSSLDALKAVFTACGLRPRDTSPIYLADPKKLLPAELPLEITFAIGDSFYLSVPGYPFVC